MDDYFLAVGRLFNNLSRSAKLISRVGGVGGKKLHRNCIVSLALVVRLFFYVQFEPTALAQILASENGPRINVTKLDPLAKIGKTSFPSLAVRMKEKVNESEKVEVKKSPVGNDKKDEKKKSAKKKKEEVNTGQMDVKTDDNSIPVQSLKPEISMAILDPMAKIGQGDLNIEQGKDNKSCDTALLAATGQKDPAELQREEDLKLMVGGYPIEEMVPYIAKRDRATGSYLVAIAKKESDWGKHTPKKNGRECYNFWGFKGSYNLTESGYSCFDSPEQAIQMVGDKIFNLVEKKVDTPERMVVWKCGSSCAGHDPESVRKWISDVGGYYYKLNS